MPSRVIRGEINASDSLSRVSIEADLTFRALIVAVDDFGRMDARPAVLKAALFPMRRSVTENRLLKWIHELADEGCVRLYESEGRPYLALPAWEKHRGGGRRASESKFPQPPDFTDSREILGNPRKRQEILPGSEGRVACSEKREASERVAADAAPPSPPKARKTLCPDAIPEHARPALKAWAEKHGFTPDQCRYGWIVVRDWSHSNTKLKSDWLATWRNAMREGWALKGYGVKSSKPQAEVRNLTAERLAREQA